MKLDRSFRTNLSLLLLTAFVYYSLISNIRLYGLNSPNNIGLDALSVYVNRFNGLRDTLAFHDSAGHIGEGWFQAQYTLAPTVLIRDSSQPLVVAYFGQEPSDIRAWAEKELKLVIDLDNGVRLYEQATKQ